MKIKRFLCAALAAVAMSVSAGTPKYIFYFIADGMGPGIVMAANTYLRMVKDRPEGLVMTQFPVASVCQTYSLTSPVTDSAAAGTALACGVKTQNGMIGMDGDSVPVQSVAQVLQKHGYGVGIVTTCTPNDATPGP
ncbi:MAG: alkaline phosphatase, partial [Muribaculaceae bacterium]|nr:alkaline phosphatase [Muribaculaceae bacterium]